MVTNENTELLGIPKIFFFCRIIWLCDVIFLVSNFWTFFFIFLVTWISNDHKTVRFRCTLVTDSFFTYIKFYFYVLILVTAFDGCSNCFDFYQLIYPFIYSITDKQFLANFLCVIGYCDFNGSFIFCTSYCCNEILYFEVCEKNCLNRSFF